MQPIADWGHVRRPARRAAGILCALALCLPLAACGKALQGAENTANSAGASTQQSASATAQDGDGTTPGGAELVPVVIQFQGMARDNASGFYREEMPYFNNERYMTFYDYTTMEQRFLCTLPGCAHRGEGCEAYTGLDMQGTVSPFVLGDKLYYIRGSMTLVTPEQGQWRSALERRNLDGSGAEVLVEGSVLENHFSGSLYTDGAALYALDGYTEQTLTRVDLATGEVTKQTIPVGDQPNWLGGSYGRSLLSI